MRFLFGRLDKPEKNLKVNAHIKSGVAFFDNGRLQEAKTQFEKALMVDPNHIWALGGLGRCYYEMGKSDLAFPLLKKSIEKKPDYTMAHYLLGEIYYADGNFSEALDSFSNALKSNNDRSEFANIHLALSMTYRELGEIERTIKEYRAALSYEPDRVDIHEFIAKVCLELDDYKQAVKHLKKADPKKHLVQQNLAWALWYANERDQAISSLKRAIQVFPNDSKLYSLLGQFLFEIGRLEEAIEVLETGITLAEVPNAAWYFLGDAYYSMGSFDKALKVYEDFLQKSPNDVLALVSIGYIFLEQKNIGKALQVWQRAAEIAPENTEVRLSLAYGLHLNEEFNEALKQVDYVLGVEPKNGIAHQRKGLVLHALGKIEAAETEFRQASSLGYIKALLDLAELYKETGNLSMARQSLEKFIGEADKLKDGEWMDMTNYQELAETMLKELK